MTYRRRSYSLSEPQIEFLESEATSLGISVGELLRRIVDAAREERQMDTKFMSARLVDSDGKTIGLVEPRCLPIYVRNDVMRTELQFHIVTSGVVANVILERPDGPPLTVEIFNPHQHVDPDDIYSISRGSLSL